MEASTGYQTTVDADTFHPHDTPQAEIAEQPAAPEMLALPPPPTASSTASRSGNVPQAGPSQTLQMDHLGPMVIGADGSISRISNWDKLTQREQEVGGGLRTLRARWHFGMQPLPNHHHHCPMLLCLCRSLCGASRHATVNGCSDCVRRRHRLHRAPGPQPPQQQQRTQVDWK